MQMRADSLQCGMKAGDVDRKQATPCERWPGELSRQMNEAVWYCGTLPRDESGGLLADAKCTQERQQVFDVHIAVIVGIMIAGCCASGVNGARLVSIRPTYRVAFIFGDREA